MAATELIPANPGYQVIGSLSISTAADGLSEVLDLNGNTLMAIQMSTAWTDASLTFAGSVDGSTSLANIYTSTGGELTYATSAGRLLQVDPNFWIGVRGLQLRSGTSGAAVAQAAARTIRLLAAPLYRSR